MSEFEDNLWREVERSYGSEPLSDAPDPPAAPGIRACG